jgi:hypothetical protein
MVKMDTRRRIRLVVLGVVLALAIAGCMQNVEATQVVGTWVHAGPQGVTAELVLSADGKASGRDIPRAILFGMEPLDWTNTYGFFGTWELHEHNQVILNIDQVVVGGLVKESGSGTSLAAKSDGDSVTLSQPLGDPDNGDDFVFERK